jgi:prevent-host-death family protein
MNLVYDLRMTETNIHEAKTHFSRLIRQVEAGQEVVISRAGKPVARLVPVTGPRQPRVLGRYRGRIWIADDFDGPLPAAIQEAFEGTAD